MSDNSMTLDKRSLGSQATGLLRDRILGGEIRVGDRIMENELAKELGLSRGTIRSALHQLVAEELIVQVPYSGWRIPEMSEHDAWELNTMRSTLEGLAARQAAEQLDDEGCVELKLSYDNLLEASAAGDLKRIAETDLALHRTIMKLSGNSRLYRYFTMIERQVQLLIAQSNAEWARPPEEIGSDHEALVSAILAGDGTLAERLGREI